MNIRESSTATKRDWNVYEITFQDLRLAIDFDKFDKISETHPKMNREALQKNMNWIYSNYSAWVLKYIGIAKCGSDRIKNHLEGKDEIGLLGCYKEDFKPKCKFLATLKDQTYEEATKIEEKYSEMANEKAIEDLKNFGIVTSVCGVYKKAVSCQEVYTYPDNPKHFAPKCIQDLTGKKHLWEL